MKKILLILFALFNAAMACPVCQRANANKPFAKLTHGAEPQNKWDYLIVWTITAITIYALYYTIKVFIKPREKNTDHIKYSILNFETT
jgi:hypothetical protein